MAGVAARLETERWVPAAAVAVASLVAGLLSGVDPVVSIAATLSLALLLVTLSDLTAGLVVFTQFAFLEALLVLGPFLSFAKIAGAVLAVSWVARVSTQSDNRVGTFFSAHPGPAYLFALFLCWVMLSVTWSENSGDALLDVSRYGLNLVLFVIVFSAVQTRRQAGWVLGGLIVGAGLTAAYGLFFQPAFDDPAAATTRIGSTVGNPNSFASLLVAGLPLALGAAFACRRMPGLRLGAIAIAGVCIPALILTGSRGGAIGLAVGIITAIAVAGRWRGRAAMVAITLTAVTLAIFLAYAPTEVRERFTLPGPGEVQKEGRTTIWQVAWRMFEDEPVTGVGVGNYRVSAPHYAIEPGTAGRTDRVIDTPDVAHNAYLQVLAELGVIGAALFGAILVFSLASAVSAARRFAQAGDLPMEIMARALFVAMAAILATEFFTSDQFNKVLWLLLALGPSLLAVARSQARPARQ